MIFTLEAFTGIDSEHCAEQLPGDISVTASTCEIVERLVTDFTDSQDKEAMYKV
jgi:hypothetical protein